MTTPKQIALQIINTALGNASDNVYRAKRSFQNFSPEEMQKEHGQSGQSRQSILDGYLDFERKVQAAYDWVEAQPE